MGCFSSKLGLSVFPLTGRPLVGPPIPPVPKPTPSPPPTESSSTTPQRKPSKVSVISSEILFPRNRVKSTPQTARPSKKSSSLPESIVKSRSQHAVLKTRDRLSDSEPKLQTLALPRAGIRALTPTIHQVLSNRSKFRILVVGKKLSGKSSLIKTVFKVDTSAALGHINQEIYCDDNRYLIFHECSAFGPGDDQNLEQIRDFISNRTDPGRPADERLHAVWVCVPAANAISGSIEEGIKEILDMNRVPVIVAFTKFDRAIAIESGIFARINARAKIEQSCRSLFHREIIDVPAVIVSVKPGFSDLIDNLIVTTNTLITGSRAASAPSERWRAQGAKSRIAHVPLVWSAALRVNRDIFIQASIEVGRSRYWRNLWTSLDFADENLKECVNVIHTDIVEIWNLNETRYLFSAEFKKKISHVVCDLAGPAGSVPLSLDWLNEVYRGSQENVRCVMGYIVDLTVILVDIFRITSDDVAMNVQMAVDKHVNSGRRDRIHGDVRLFVTETFEARFEVTERDLVLEKIIELIRGYCATVS